MSEDQLCRSLKKICGISNISNEFSVVDEFSKDMSFFPKKFPKYVIWVDNIKQNFNPNSFKKRKKIFDPNNVLNPGVLCFDD